MNIVFENENIKNQTSFKIGGIVKTLITPRSEDELVEIITKMNKNNEKYIVLGACSNVLISDNGLNFNVVKLSNEYKNIKKLNDDMFEVSSGYSLIKFAKEVSNQGYTGMEFATGIPGTIGGAVYMNAGAYGGEIKDSLVSVKVINENNEIVELQKDELELGYRTSIFKNSKTVIISAKFKFEKGNIENIEAKIGELLKLRIEKQPLEFPSAGSTFKRPENDFAARLIEDCGLKGLCVNDAEVSVKHAGFVINKGNAKAEDVIKLTNIIKEKVYEKHGISLELEIEYIGE